MFLVDNHFMLPYYEMVRNCGLWNTPNSNGITLKKFKEGSTIFVYDNTSSHQYDNSFELIKPGTTSWYANFADPIPGGGVTVLFYAEYDCLVKIDKFRQLTTDLTV